MIVTTPSRGRVAAALIATLVAVAISVAPPYSTQGARTAGSPTAVCGGAGNCS